MIIHYSALTEIQKNLICNGCGGKGGWINPPEFLFHASCNQHDFYYWRGGSESDRLKADNAFYEAMKIDVNRAVWYKRAYYRMIAYVYYRSVRLVGKKYFNYDEMRSEI